MVDTMHNIIRVHDTLYIRGTEGIDVLNKTDAFYNNAWARLTVIIGVIGFILPVVIALLQRYAISLDKKKLKDDIQKEILKTQNELKDQIRKEFDEELKKNEKKMEEIQAHGRGGLLFVQAISYENRGDFSAACAMYIMAAGHAISSNSARNINAIFNNIVHGCLPHLSIEELNNEEFCPEWQKDFIKLYSVIKAREDLKDIHEKLEDVKLALDNLPPTKAERLARQSPPPAS